MRISLIICILLVLSVKILSQSQLSDSSRFDNVHIVPSTLLDPNPRLRIGFERVFYDKSFSLEIGLGNYNSFKYYDQLLELNHYYRFFELRLERKVFPKRWKRAGYHGFELFYYSSKKTLSTGGRYIPNLESDIHYFSFADFHKQKYGFNYRIGYYGIAAETFVFDFYCGVGVAIRDVSYSNIQGDTIPVQSDYSRIAKLDNHEGVYIFPQLNLGLKLGLIFNKQ